MGHRVHQGNLVPGRSEDRIPGRYTQRSAVRRYMTHVRSQNGVGRPTGKRVDNTRQWHALAEPSDRADSISPIRQKISL